jgi:hypothetical protein
MKAKDPMMLERVGEAEAETHDARRQVEAMRELLVLIRDHVDLPDDIIAKIDAALRESAQKSPRLPPQFFCRSLREREKLQPESGRWRAGALPRRVNARSP